MTASSGQCRSCGGKFAKRGMARHLTNCVPRQSGATSQAASKPLKRKPAIHLLVEGRWGSSYWLHLALAPTTTFGELDRFLRAVWLECCGHMSAFRLPRKRREMAPLMALGGAMDFGDLDMDLQIAQVLPPGAVCQYEYDFGSTTELVVKVIGSLEVPGQSKRIQVLARNDAPEITCGQCGKPAAQICSECVWQGRGWLCEECVKTHECGEEMLLPVVNSPRTGVCGYCGPSQEIGY